MARIAVGATVVVVSALAARAELSTFEVDLFRAFNDLPNTFRPVMIVVTQFGTVACVVGMALVALLLRRRWMGLGLLVAGMAGYTAARALKVLIARGRPIELVSDVVVRVAAGGNGIPSGHSAVAAALATAAAPHLSRPVRRVVWGLALVVGLSRLYLGVHMPLDVVSGLALGWAAGSIVNLAVGTPDPR